MVYCAPVGLIYVKEKADGQGFVVGQLHSSTGTAHINEYFEECLKILPDDIDSKKLQPMVYVDGSSGLAYTFVKPSGSEITEQDIQKAEAYMSKKSFIWFEFNSYGDLLRYIEASYEPFEAYKDRKGRYLGRKEFCDIPYMIEYGIPFSVDESAELEFHKREFEELTSDLYAFSEFLRGNL